MTIDLQICIFSHLNDAKIEFDFNPERGNKRIEFVKFLIQKHMPEIKIDVESEWEEFIAETGR